MVWVFTLREKWSSMFGVAALAGLAVLMAACGSQSPASTPGMTVVATFTAEAATPKATTVPAATEAPAAVPTVAASAPAETSTVEAGDTGTVSESGRVAAPTFNPAVNKIAFKPILDGFKAPVMITNAGDESGRLFVVEKPGTIRIVRDGSALPAAFLDITDRVLSSGSEQGLLGVAFPPDFKQSGYFFVNYTSLKGNDTVARFHVGADTPDVADVGSEFNVLSIEDPAPNHNGGNLVFGPDGYLWIGFGDGGGGGDTYHNGQNPATLLGKMLRIDVTSDPSVPYKIPPDNPWVKANWNGADVRDEVWAVGLRNPWRYSFDRFTGDLWIGDVGQNQYEEVDYLVEGTKGGLNFGWSIMEGYHCYNSDSCDQSGLTLPVAEYDHSQGCSITGGFVYRGGHYPVLQGVYIFGDYCSGSVWATIPNPDGSWKTTKMLASGVMISSFGEDENGEMYVTDLSSGKVYQVTGE